MGWKIIMNPTIYQRKYWSSKEKRHNWETLYVYELPIFGWRIQCECMAGYARKGIKKHQRDCNDLPLQAECFHAYDLLEALFENDLHLYHNVTPQ